jgi:hypothetical protein
VCLNSFRTCQTNSQCCSGICDTTNHWCKP